MPYQQGYDGGNYARDAYYQTSRQTQQQNQHYYTPQPSVVVPPPRHVVQQTPQYRPTSHLYQAPRDTLQHSYPPIPSEFYLPYQASQLQAPPPPRDLNYQQPQYYQPQARQAPPAQGYYQPPVEYVQPSQLFQPAQHSPLQVQYQTPAEPPYQRPQSRPAPRPQASRLSTQDDPTSPDPLQLPAPRPVAQQRTATHVAIPVPRRPDETAKQQPPMQRSPKRRRSNEGVAIPVCNAPAPKPQRSTASQRVKNVPPPSSPLTELASSQVPPTPPTNVDYQATLLALSDEYVSAAYSISTSLATKAASEEQSDEYYALIAAAMGCLESVLNNYRQSDPRKEARIRLRLATLLHEETENSMEAEEVLSKGIALCERCRLSDLKYAMRHLLIRVMFKSSPKAALKSVEKVISEVEALRLVHWIYSFRFLRVSLGLQVNTHAETPALLKHLAAISAVAEELRHIAVSIVAATMEAVVQLRSGSSEAGELAQRALAAARTHQLGPEMQQLPQMRALLDCLDLCLAVMRFNPEQVAKKLQQMHENFDSATRAAGWHKAGTFLLSLGVSADADIDADTGGILKKTKSSEIALAFNWLPQGQLYTLGYLLSGFACMYNNSVDGKAEAFLNEGLKLSKAVQEPLTQSLTASSLRLHSQTSIAVALQLTLAFAYCGRSGWAEAPKVIQELHRTIASLDTDPDEWTTSLTRYIGAMCRHGEGELEEALELYSAPKLTFTATRKDATALRDLQALATLNSILIRRHLNNGHVMEDDTLLADLQSYCLQHPDKAFAAAFYVIKSTSHVNESTIIKVKQQVQAAVTAARTALNNQLLCIIMNIMTHLFFNGIVGDQAEKSARAGRTLAKKTQDELWLAVADKMYGETLALAGRHGEATIARQEAEQSMEALPKKLRETLAKVQTT